MYSKLGKGIAWLSTLLAILLPNLAGAQQSVITQASISTDVSFSAKPANCVALRQGRSCFAQVSLSWQTPVAGNVCIFEKHTNKIIHCWQNSQANYIQFEFESSEKIEYQLIASEGNRVLAETSINVSWVHKATPRKRRWRLF